MNWKNSPAKLWPGDRWYNIFIMKTINLSRILKDFSSGWIAVSSDYKKVVASGKDLNEVTQAVEKQKRNDVVLISAAKNYRGFVTSA